MREPPSRRAVGGRLVFFASVDIPYGRFESAVVCTILRIKLVNVRNKILDLLDVSQVGKLLFSPFATDWVFDEILVRQD